jgi:hypothetical protein
LRGAGEGRRTHVVSETGDGKEVKQTVEEVEAVHDSETVETKIWENNKGEWGVSCGHHITFGPHLSRLDMADISRRLVVLHYRLTRDAFMEAGSQ